MTSAASRADVDDDRLPQQRACKTANKIKANIAQTAMLHGTFHGSSTTEADEKLQSKSQDLHANVPQHISSRYPHGPDDNNEQHNGIPHDSDDGGARHASTASPHSPNTGTDSKTTCDIPRP